MSGVMERFMKNKSSRRNVRGKRGSSRQSSGRSAGRQRPHKQTAKLRDEPAHDANNPRKQLKHRDKGMTPVVTPRRPTETKEEETDNMTEHEIATNALPRGQDHFLDMPERFNFIRYLGHGSYGHVCEGTDSVTQDKVAMKKITKIFDNDIDAKRLLRELNILRTLGEHENIVTLIDIAPPSEDINEFNSLILVFEFVDTDLAKLFQSDQFFSTLHVQYMMYQLLSGLKYMHSANIAHRDLKPANILINENCTLKICDFGLARGLTANEEPPFSPCEDALDDLSEEESKRQERTAKKRVKGNVERNMTKHVVTRWYRAPEVILLQQRRDTLLAVDMWSVGCIFAELLRMIPDFCRDPQQRQPLFPGRSSFPLSANDPFAWADRSDQLNVIFDTIGLPSADDIARLEDEKARSYLSSLPRPDPKKMTLEQIEHPLRSFFPNIDAMHAENLLEGLLRFDVRSRMTVDEAIEDPFLQRVRDEEAEKNHAPVTFNFEDVPVTLKKLRALVMDEIGSYQPAFLDRAMRIKEAKQAQRATAVPDEAAV